MSKGKSTDPALVKEVQQAIDQTNALMTSPEGDMHYYGYSKKKDIRLTLPESLVHFAMYLAHFEPGKGAGPRWQELLDGRRKLDDPQLVSRRNLHLEDVLVKYLKQEFDQFSDLTHPLLDPEPESTDEEPKDKN